jgi:glyceraldehyde 3-phosphate dehydrogenase
MTTNIGINGFGRIGRSVFRILSERDDINVVCINDLFDNEQLAYLLKYDTVMGIFKRDVKATEDAMYIGDQKVVMTEFRDPAAIPWRDLGVDVVIESTGVFRDKASLEKHLSAGASKILLTVPAKEEIDATIVLGVNDDDLKAEHRIVSNASCTTNCLAPIAKILDESFGIEEGFITRCTPIPMTSVWPMCRTKISAAAAPPAKTLSPPPPVRPRPSARCFLVCRVNWTAWPCGCLYRTVPSWTL